MTELFKNKPARNAVLLLLAVFILLTAIGFAILYQNNRNMTQAFIRQDIALVGGMAENKPVSQLSILTGNVSQTDVNAGNKLLEQYSYDEELPLAANLYYQHIFNLQIFFYCICAAVFFIAALMIVLMFMASLNKRLRFFTQKFTALDFSTDSPQQEEGDFAVLISAVIALAKRSSFHAETLQKDKEYLKNLLSDISHQLKTPLAALRMYNEILIGKPDLSTEKREEFLLRSKNQIDRTDWLIQGLLKMARVEAGAVEMNRRDCYIVDTIEQAVAPFCESARQKGVFLTTHIPSDILFAHDSDWVAEAIDNIVKNALEHTPEGGKINIEAEETPLSVSIKIADNGEGMETSEIPHIFERFYRKNPGANTGNAGIGLSLAKEILEKNGGDIFVKSAPDFGSEFTITFLKNYE
jgi:signal transduction histidine kinase